MYRPTLGADGIMDMLEAVPVKFARELYRRLPPKGRKVYFQVGQQACVCMCVCVYRYGTSGGWWGFGDSGSGVGL